MIVPVVIFFGGYLSTQFDMDRWVTSANMQDRGQHIFEAYAYPEDADSSVVSAIKHAEKTIEKVVDEVSTYEATHYTIVGHSSGCAISNEVANRLLAKRVENFTLVCLDGFRPNKKLETLEKTQLWSARCGDIHARNWDALNDSKRFHVYEAKNCKTNWALHFSLVNKMSSDELVRHITDGYKGVVANLAFLEQEQQEEFKVAAPNVWGSWDEPKE